jgi:hypothetical protein
MKRIALVFPFAFLAFCSQLHGAEKENWSVSLIPQELKQKANAVVRLHEKTLKVFDNGSAEETSRIVITILNENGQKYKYFVEHYNKYSSVSGIKGTIYDKSGKKVKSIPQKDINDYSAIAGFSLFDDSRVKVIAPEYGNYPYTIEYTFTKKHSSFFMLPGWQVYPGYDISVQNSIYNLTLSPNSKVKFKGNDALRIEPIVKTDGKGNATRTWIASNCAAIENEPFSGYLHEDTPLLLVAPESFTMDGYFGSNSSWMELGNWAYKLGEGRNVVSQETRSKLLELTADLETDTEKARAIYEYMQGKVRYVNIAIGIGGWQPFPAETVEKYWYGDCKALSNYMKSLLDVVDIKSYYCLVRAGEDVPNIDAEFVSSQFNHAFIMLPLEGDTIFLECTSQQVPFGYNGTFTDDRDILVVDKDNSYIKRTNVYGKDQNKTINSYLFKIDANNSASISAVNTYKGVATEDPRYIMSQKPEKQREYLLRNLNLKQVKINSLNYSEKRDIIPVIVKTAEMTAAQLGQVTSNNNIIIPFNQVSLLDELKRVSNRKTSIVIRRDQIQIDTLSYQLPSKFSIDQVPQAVSFSSEFGAYHLEVVQAENAITFIRSVEWNKGKFNSEKYNDLMLFQRRVNEADRQVMILKPI